MCTAKNKQTNKQICSKFLLYTKCFAGTRSRNDFKKAPRNMLSLSLELQSTFISPFIFVKYTHIYYVCVFLLCMYTNVYMYATRSTLGWGGIRNIPANNSK